MARTKIEMSMKLKHRDRRIGTIKTYSSIFFLFKTPLLCHFQPTSQQNC